MIYKTLVTDPVIKYFVSIHNLWNLPFFGKNSILGVGVILIFSKRFNILDRVVIFYLFGSRHSRKAFEGTKITSIREFERLQAKNRL